ncbi:hypothetical protein [Oligoflexus tunisiensis]|uniref:hypothetical protein n=1 Tax=Oligoflexus tunisiensis TaxID=708132 RepID=UPI00114D2A5B|nr:hypothetical protein [Oligoflexus tunisiensis]
MRRFHTFIGSSPEAGGTSIFMVAFAAIFIAGSLVFSSHHVRSRYKAVSLGSVGQSMLMNIVGRLRLGLTAQSSCPSLDNTLRAFRNFSTKAPSYTVSRSGPNINLPCILTEDEAKNVNGIQLELMELSNDPKALTKNLRVFVKLMITDPAGRSPPRQVSHSHGLRLRVASLDQFNVILMGSQSPLISSVGPKVTFTGPVFHANPTSVPVNQIYAANGSDRITFRDTFYVRSRFLSSDANNLDMGRFRTAFTKGIETDVLNSPVLNTFLPNSTPAWNHGFDYFYINNKTGYALPQSRNAVTSLDCSAGSAYSNIRGSLTTVPAPGGFDKASTSCGPDTLMIPVMQFMDRGSTLTVNLSPGDNMFCGLVSAGLLRINLAEPGKYAIFGHFIANGIAVTGDPGAELYIYSPNATGQIEVNLPDGISLFRNQVKALASSTATNFFLPIAARTPFLPRQPDEYLDDCGGGFKRYEASYPPLDERIGFNLLQYETAGPLYIVESTL